MNYFSKPLLLLLLVSVGIGSLVAMDNTTANLTASHVENTQDNLKNNSTLYGATQALFGTSALGIGAYCFSIFKETLPRLVRTLRCDEKSLTMMRNIPPYHEQEGFMMPNLLYEINRCSYDLDSLTRSKIINSVLGIGGTLSLLIGSYLTWQGIKKVHKNLKNHNRLYGATQALFGTSALGIGTYCFSIFKETFPRLIRTLKCSESELCFIRLSQLHDECPDLLGQYEYIIKRCKEIAPYDYSLYELGSLNRSKIINSVLGIGGTISLVVGTYLVWHGGKKLLHNYHSANKADHSQETDQSTLNDVIK